MDFNNDISSYSSDGTSRQMRFIPALDPDLVKPFDYTTVDLLQYAQAYSKFVKYYNDNNEPAGDWSQLLGDPDDANNLKSLTEMARYLDDPASVSDRQKEKFSRPHVALFLSFLGLMRHAQHEFNRLPKRHLKFYYNEVLGLRPEPARPDSVNVLFSISEDTDQFFLKAGTALNAGEDEEDKPLTYITDHSLLINHARVSQIQNLFCDQTTKKLYAAVAPARLTAAPDPAVELDRWKTFGSKVTGKEVQRGLGIASPLLMLTEGERKIIIEFNLETKDKEQLQDTFNRALFYASSVNGMINLPNGVFEIQDLSQSNSNVKYSLSLTNTAVAIEPLQSVLPGYPPCPWPIINIVWANPELVSALKLAALTITVQVKGLTKLIASNTQGPLDVTKPFEPFGNEPLIGTAFRLTHRELIDKRPDTIKLYTGWAGGIPALKDYYQTYLEVGKAAGVEPVFTNLVTGQVSVNLSEPDQNNNVQLFAGSLFDINISPIPKTNLTPPLNAAGEIAPDKINQYRHLNMVLEGDGFMQEKYGLLQNKLSNLSAKNDAPKVTARTTTEGTTYTVTGLEWSKKTLPPPYVPKLISISIDYTASVSDTDIGQIQVFALHPFGYTGPHSASDKEVLAHPYSNDGELYIGIEGLQPPQNLSVLLQLSEGSAEPEAPEAKLSWSCLQDNNWVGGLDKESSGPLILSDDSNGLLQSGIIRFSFPSGLTTGSTIMPPGLLWLRAIVSSKRQAVLPPSIYQSTDAVSDLLAVHTQAVQATFQNNDNAHTHSLHPLKPLSITELAEDVPAIDKVIQPYSSYGGRPSENDLEYNTRVSERLRHKNRALSNWDYERLVLENFQGIHKTKCNWAHKEPGLVSMVVVPNIRLQHPFAPFEPKAPVKTLREIENFLQAKAPPFVEVKVSNPGYSIIQLKFQVKFKKGSDPGYYVNVLQEELKKFLSPWAYDEGADMEFDQTIYSGGIAYFIEQQYYVDFIASLELFRFRNGKKEDSSKYALSNHDRSAIWVSAQEHYISVIKTDTPDYGIGAMRVEYDFQLAE